MIIIDSEKYIRALTSEIDERREEAARAVSNALYDHASRLMHQIAGLKKARVLAMHWNEQKEQ